MKGLCVKCPRCLSMDDRVVDSRIVKEGEATRRRRECAECGYRFTTYEYIERSYPVVVKNDGKCETFDRNKLTKGIERACEKRSITREKIQDMVDSIILKITDEFSEEVNSGFIGELVMKELQKVDEVAYVRFASVYRQFKDVSQFKEELDKILKSR